jgi:hypothetical protein
MSTFKGIRAGDRVVYTDSHGTARSGRAGLLLTFHTHVVLDTGGKYGRPAVVNASNYVGHTAQGVRA